MSKLPDQPNIYELNIVLICRKRQTNSFLIGENRSKFLNFLKTGLDDVEEHETEYQQAIDNLIDKELLRQIVEGTEWFYKLDLEKANVFVQEVEQYLKNLIENLLSEGIPQAVIEETFLEKNPWFNQIYEPFAKKFKRDILEKLQPQANIVPMLDDINVTEIHSALDFKNGTCFITQSLPCYNRMRDMRQKIPCIVTSKKEILPITPEILRQCKIELINHPMNLPKRWSLESIKGFQAGSARSAEPGEIFIEIENQYKYYIDFSDYAAYFFCSLWVIGTYFFPLFKSYPYVYTGGMKETAKTKTLTVSACLAFNSISSGNMSTSTIFRLIQNGRCSLFIDETEFLANPERRMDFRNILLNGYKPGFPTYRTEKSRRERLIPESFEVYGPKMLANIGGVEDVLQDRCTTFIMQRTLNKEIADREIDPIDSRWQITRDKLYIFAMTYWPEIKKTYDELQNDTDLHSRDWELWKPIFALAKFFDDKGVQGLYENVKELAEKKSKERQTENATETKDYVLVEALIDLVDADKYYAVKKIKEKMLEHYEDEQQWLTSEWLGRALKRLGLMEKRRIGSGMEYFITVSAIKDLANRLCITATQPAEHTQLTLNVGSVRNESSEEIMHKAVQYEEISDAR